MRSSSTTAAGPTRSMAYSRSRSRATPQHSPRPRRRRSNRPSPATPRKYSTRTRRAAGIPKPLPAATVHILQSRIRAESFAAPAPALIGYGGFFLRRFFLHRSRRRSGGSRGLFRLTRQAQFAQPRGLGAHRRSRIFIIKHRALAILGLPQLAELTIGSGLVCVVVGQCNLHW